MIKATAIGVLAVSAAVAAFAQQASFNAPALRIASGDLIDLEMYDNADLSGHFRVNENGDVRLPLMGEVHVAGETAEQAAELFEKRYVEQEILKPANSHATVQITEYATQGIVVSGEVHSPGTYPALGVRMFNDVITAAGGVLQTASREVVIAHRGDPDHTVKVEYDPFLANPLIPQVQLLPGDTVTVPKAGVVYVVGVVGRPGVFVLEGHEPMTALKIIAQASPDRHESNLKQVILIRTDETGHRAATILPMGKIEQGKEPDVAVKDGDILYVPHSFLGQIAPQAISSALGMLSSLVMYRFIYQ